jgi:hypothetical protein
MSADETPPLGSSTDLAIFGGGDNARTEIYRVGSNAVSRPVSSTSAGNESVLLATRNDVYVQNQGSNYSYGISEVDTSTGRVVHRYNYQEIPYVPIPGSKGETFGPDSQGLITSLVLSNGQLFAFQYNGYSAAVDNLTNGTRRLIRGYGALGGGVLAANGDLYVIAWLENWHESSFDVVRIDPTTLAVVSTIHTGVRAKSVRHAQMQALPNGDIAIFVAQQYASAPGVPVDAILWRLSTSGLARRNLPANIGLDMRAFANGVYLFGGPGRNIVARLNLSDMSLTMRVPSLATPAGTFLFALT